MTRTLVTPEVRARILEYARNGLSNAEIADAVNVPGLHAPYIAAVLTKMRQNGAIIPYRNKGYEQKRLQREALLTSIVVTINQATLEYLKRAGDRRCIDPAYLAGELIEAIARDQLIDAVLDDGVTT